MVRARKLSDQAVAVVLVLGEAPAAWRYGYDLCQEVGLEAGSMYPILMRLAEASPAGSGSDQRPLLSWGGT